MSSDPRIRAGMQAQLARRESEVAAGARSLGWKIGLNVPAVQHHLGIDSPVVGHLTSLNELVADEVVSLRDTTSPAVEPEIAIHLDAAVPGDADRATARAAIGGFGAALELVDVDLPFEDVEAILAGNVFHRGVLFGMRLHGVRAEGVTVTVRGGEQPVSAKVSDDLVEVVRFVASFLASHGAALEAGDRIIAGSVTPPVAVTPSARTEADFGPFGRLALEFA